MHGVTHSFAIFVLLKRAEMSHHVKNYAKKKKNHGDSKLYFRHKNSYSKIASASDVFF